MRRLPVAAFLLVAVAAAAAPGAARAAAPAAVTVAPAPPGGGRIQIDIGWIAPLGDLADGLDASPAGAGARPGFEIGAAWSFALSPAWSLGPSAHLLGYGDATGLGATGEESLSATSLRWGAELVLCPPREGMRWFAGLEPAYVRSHLSGPGKDHVTAIDASTGRLGVSLRAGVSFGNTEFSAVYHVNRFRSYGFFASGEELAYDWDTVAVRMGWRLP